MGQFLFSKYPKIKIQIFFLLRKLFFWFCIFFFPIFFQRYMVNLREAMRFKKTRKDILLSHDDSYDLNNYPESLRAHLIFILCLLEKIWIFSTIFTKRDYVSLCTYGKYFFFILILNGEQICPPATKSKTPKAPVPTFNCDLCGISGMPEQQYQQHLKGTHHITTKNKNKKKTEAMTPLMRFLIRYKRWAQICSIQYEKQKKVADVQLV